MPAHTHTYTNMETCMLIDKHTQFWSQFTNSVDYHPQPYTDESRNKHLLRHEWVGELKHWLLYLWDNQIPGYVNCSGLKQPVGGNGRVLFMSSPCTVLIWNPFKPSHFIYLNIYKHSMEDTVQYVWLKVTVISLPKPITVHFTRNQMLFNYVSFQNKVEENSQRFSQAVDGEFKSNSLQ